MGLPLVNADQNPSVPRHLGSAGVVVGPAVLTLCRRQEIHLQASRNCTGRPTTKQWLERDESDLNDFFLVFCKVATLSKNILLQLEKK